MKSTIRRSNLIDDNENVDILTKDIEDNKLIIFFCGETNFENISHKIKDRFPKSTVVGVTTYLTITGDKSNGNEIVLIALDDIEFYSGVIEDGGRYPDKYIDELKNNVAKIENVEESVCLEFCSMSYFCEEISLDALNSVLELKKIHIFGSSAGSRNSIENVAVSYNGEIKRETCIYILIRNKSGKIHFYKENIYKPMGFEFIATDVEVSERIVYEYDNEPASKVIAKALKTDVNLLPEMLRSHPMGRIVDGDILITDFCKLEAENGISYYANIYNNTKLSLLTVDDYEKVISNTMNKIRNEVKSMSFSIVMNCISRTKLFENDNYMEEFTNKLSGTLGQYVCISGYGEQLDKHHLNQTMIIAVFE